MALQEEFEVQGNFLFRYRGVLPITILLVSILTFISHVLQTKQGKQYDINQSYNYFCLLITLFGLAVRIITVGFSAKNTSGRNTKSQLADVLNTSGVYSLVRHPLYVGNFFMWLGIALLSQNIWFTVAFVFIYWVYYERIMFAEEQFLRKKFAGFYLNWASVTPAVIPTFKNYKSASTTFNIRKVIRQEKTGLLLVFILYFFFNEVAVAVSVKKFILINNFWLYAMAISMVIYLCIKLFQKNSRLLD